MNPNNNNLNYLLGLPTPRLLRLYRNVRAKVRWIDDSDWSSYESLKEELEKLPKDKEIPKLTCHPRNGRPTVNPLYWAREVAKLIELKTALKKELDTREHIVK